jgi:Tol biopolymer transport system component
LSSYPASLRDVNRRSILTSASRRALNSSAVVEIGVDGFLPAFSPDGKKIDFVSNDEGQTTHIYVMNADGRNVRNLTTKTKVNDDAPAWQTLP